MAHSRVTLTLSPHLLEAARRECSGNLSGFVSGLIEAHLQRAERERLRNRLREGYIEGAALDLEIAEAYSEFDCDDTEDLEA